MAKFKPGQSGNPNGRPKGRVTKRTEILEAVRDAFGSEQAFWAHVAQSAKGGDNECLRILAARLRAPLKAVAPTLHVDLDLETLHSSVESILREVAAGNIPSDQARDLITSVQGVNVSVKMQELGDELDALKKAMQEAGRARLQAV